jgi:hypothetical protein
VKKALIPLAGMPNQRDMDSLQSLIEGKDQRFRNVYIIPIDNPLIGSRKVYVEKRPGFEAVSQLDCLGEVAEGCNATAIHYSRALNKYITAFCGSDIYADCTSVGETVDPEPGSGEEPLCDPLLECFFASDSGADVSGNGASFSIGENVISGEAMVLENNPQIVSSWTGGAINSHSTANWTWQFYLHFSGGISGAASRGLSSVASGSGVSVDNRLFLETNTTGSFYRQILYRNGILFDGFRTGSQVPLNTWVHIAVLQDHDTNSVSIYFDGVRVANNTGNLDGSLPSLGGSVTLGGSNTPGDGTIKITDFSIYPCLLYSGSSFTPPDRVGGGA